MKLISNEIYDSNILNRKQKINSKLSAFVTYNTADNISCENNMIFIPSNDIIEEEQCVLSPYPHVKFSCGSEYNDLNIRDFAFLGWYTDIRDNAFFNNSKIENIKLRVSSIGSGAFSFCDNLKTVKINSDSKNFLGRSAFQQCKKLEYVDFTLSKKSCLEYLGIYMFWECSSLKTVIFPNTIKYLEVGCFKRCKSLLSMDFSKCPLETVDTYAFYGCRSLKLLRLPKTITKIGQEPFYYMSPKLLIDIDKTVEEANEFQLGNYWHCGLREPGQVIKCIDGDIVINSKDITSFSYEENNKIVQLDAIDNSGFRNHKTNPLNWKNLINNKYTTKLQGNPIFEAKEVIFNENSICDIENLDIAKNINSGNITISYVFKNIKINENGVLLNFNDGISSILKITYSSLSSLSEINWRGDSITSNSFLNNTVNSMINVTASGESIYVNGNLMGSNGIKNDYKETLYFPIGSIAGQSSQINNEIFSVRIFTRRFTPEEIYRDYIIDKVRFGE